MENKKDRRMLLGNSFQSLETITEKALSPMVEKMKREKRKKENGLS